MTYDEVRHAYDALRAEGLEPSANRIVARIGGSKRDVVRFLRQVREADAAVGQITAIHPWEGFTMLTRQLPCKLTTEELLSKAFQVAEQREKRAQVLLEIASLQGMIKGKKEQQADIETEIARLHRVIRSGQEDREVQCREETAYDTFVVRIIRLDTGEVVGTRAMTLEERQQPLPFVATGKGDGQ